jgi:hypothetical protein
LRHAEMVVLVVIPLIDVETLAACVGDRYPPGPLEG